MDIGYAVSSDALLNVVINNHMIEKNKKRKQFKFNRNLEILFNREYICIMYPQKILSRINILEKQ